MSEKAHNSQLKRSCLYHGRMTVACAAAAPSSFVTHQYSY